MTAAALVAAPDPATGSIHPPSVWVIYDERHIYPPQFVARRFLIGAVFTFTTDDEIRAETLREVRDLLPAGLLNIGRPKDDPKSVVEVWA